jgi:hypothetical protein
LQNIIYKVTVPNKVMGHIIISDPEKVVAYEYAVQHFVRILKVRRHLRKKHSVQLPENPSKISL